VRVLVTGHTGFKGAWLSAWLNELGAEVHGIALPPATTPNLFDSLDLSSRITSYIVDIRDQEALERSVQAIKPDVVFHLAAQALVRRSYAQPIETFDTNILGTAKLLDACGRTPSIRAIVCVTTDKVYDNREWPWPYREIDHLGGKDPYSASKACAELVSAVYQRIFRRPDNPIAIATARGGNVVGGGDWSEDRLIPDIVQALRSGAPLVLRNPQAIRPWQHVLELCEGYLELGARLLAHGDDFASAWNFGPHTSSEISVGEIVDILSSTWGKSGFTTELRESPLHEAQILRLDIAKSLSKLDWRPRLGIRETLGWTADWYRRYYDDSATAWNLTTSQIQRFEAIRTASGSLSA
jgi:CDP-glucose 4,6-dehydratase